MANIDWVLNEKSRCKNTFCFNFKIYLKTNNFKFNGYWRMRRCFLEGGKNLNNSFTFFMKLVLKMYFIDKFSSFSSNYYDNF